MIHTPLQLVDLEIGKLLADNKKGGIKIKDIRDIISKHYPNEQKHLEGMYVAGLSDGAEYIQDHDRTEDSAPSPTDHFNKIYKQ